MANTSGSRQAAWEFFGAELKRHREAAGFTQAELGMRVFVSGAYIGQFELAVRKPQLDAAERIDEVLQTAGFFERMCRKLINNKRFAEYFAPTAELEALATQICDFEHAVVQGLLQTPAYARAVMLSANPIESDEYIDEKVAARMDRAHILHGSTTPPYWAILHETVLRIPVGGPTTMAEQLDHIAALTRRRRATVQVIPFSAGVYPAMGKPLRLMEFDDAPPTAYTEGLYTGNLLDYPAMVKRAQRTYDRLRAVALSPEASLALIESAAEDYRRCASTT
ncbi:helix-turn-helix transcriptional regulator [Streptomyces sp. ISL-100]|uniref:helix-turn-helix domain-containing protein n=1 Tax=Streptomyces sp. ISL-100 TaxID=2819173 RepID=UPI001BE90625|nr:helix-turn-helix transcriptional regulator [Streptomyces sp. ISL-100]MBT2400983.1 helix-turn-helix transcriptional regulator [Streptomyces sp. ISL-100]